MTTTATQSHLSAANRQDFVLLFDVTNSQKQAVEIGSLGAPLEFNNVCGRSIQNDV